MRLRETLRSRQGQILTVLDIGTRKVCCIIARIDIVHSRTEGPIEEIHIIGFGQQASAGMRSGVVRDLAAAERSVRAAVSQAEDMAGVEIRNVLLAVACGRIQSLNFCASANISGHTVRAQDIERAFSVGEQYATQDQRKLLHMLPISFLLDGGEGVKDPVGMVGEKLSVDFHAVTADYQPLRNLCLVVERCHLNIQGLVASPYASGLACLSDDELKLGVTCIDIGGWTTTLSVFVEDHFVYADAIAMGSEQITADIANGLSVPLEEAERIKNLYGGVATAASDIHELIKVHRAGDDFATNSRITRAQLVNLIRPRLEEILVTIADRLARSDMAYLAGQRVVLTGGGSQLTGLAQFAASLLGKAVRIGSPVIFEGLPPYASTPAFSAAVGLLRYPSQPYATRDVVPTRQMAQAGGGYMSQIRQWFRESF